MYYSSDRIWEDAINHGGVVTEKGQGNVNEEVDRFIYQLKRVGE